jgi:hypothetical protein
MELAMPIVVTNTDNEKDTPTRELESAYALGTAVVGGITYVIAGGISDNGVSVFRLDAGGTLTSVFDLPDSPALHLNAPYNIESAIVGGSTYIYVSGFDTGFSALRVNADGSLTLVQDVTDTAATLLNYSFGSETVTVSGITYLYVASYGEAGLTRYRVENNGALTFLGTVADSANPSHLLYGAARPHAVTVGAATFLLVPGSAENGLNLFQVGADGSLTFVTAVGDSGALELDDAFHVASAAVGGVTYVYVCGLADDGVSVFTLSAAGALANVQNITDTAGLLLNGPVSLDVFQEGGQQYLSVTGQDHGVSLFQIGSDGLLTLDQSIADNATINLAFESHMVSAVVDGVTYLIGASSGDGGISAFRVGNTAPTLGANNGATVNEGAAVTITAAVLDYNDAEHADSAITYTVTGATAGTVRLSGNALGTGGTFTQADVNNGLVSYAHDGSETTSGSFGFSVSDGAGGSVSGQSFAITVTPVNDAPAVDLNGAGDGIDNSASYTEGDGLLLLAPGATVQDVDSSVLQGGTISIGGFQPGDRLTLDSAISASNSGAAGPIDWSYDPTTGILTLSSLGVPGAADFQSALRMVRYYSTSENPGSERTVTWTLSDGTSSSTSATTALGVTSVNDSPIVPDSPAVAVTEGFSATVNAALTVSDLELDARNSGAGNYGGAQFVMSRSGGPSAQDQFIISNANAVGFTVTGTFLGGGDLQSGGQTFGNWSWDGAGTLTVNFTSAQTAATTALVNAVLRTIEYNNASDMPPATVDLVYTLNDGAPAAGQGSGGSATDSGTVRMNITATNDPPWLDLLNSGNAGDGTDVEIAYIENDGAKLLAPNANVIDPDSPHFGGGQLTAGFGATGLAEDRLTIVSQGMGAGQIGVSGNAVFYGNVQIATFAGGTNGTTPLVVTFDTDATPAAVIALVRRIAYTNVSESPGTADRSIAVTITDGGPGISNQTTALVHVTSVEDLPVAGNDTAATTEAATKNIAVLTNDSDADGPAPQIAEINDVPVVAGDTVTLTSGATAKLEIDGTITYDPNGKFNQLTAPGSGAVNTSALDVFSYKLAGAVSTANVSVTVNGIVSPDERLLGDGTANVITGTPQRDYFMVQQGGNDTIHALAGNDTVYFGAAFTPADTVNGGDGVDSIILQGSYAMALGTGTASNIGSIESISLAPGSFTDWGDTSGAFYDYDLTTLDSNIDPGATLKINGFYLSADEDLSVNGVAEKDGKLLILAGQGVDDLVGGDGNDIFVFGHDGRFGTADVVEGGAGYDSLYLRGDFSLDFTAGGFTGGFSGIESVTLGSTTDTQFVGGGDGEFDYDIVWDDAMLASGVTITVNGSGLGASETMRFIGTDELLGHFKLFGGAAGDTLTGGGGNDLLYGGLGWDELTGNGGTDVFRYQSTAESAPTPGNFDMINGFTHLVDKIDLSVIDANVNVAGNQAFAFIGSSAFAPAGGSAGQLRATQLPGAFGPNTWQIEGDIDGNGTPDLLIRVEVQALQPLTAADFYL